ncbi:transposase [Agrobacterium tumefaciens]|nr:transposase [Agrobacterium tumefaciens]
MGKSNFSEEFKRDAVRQITERGYPVELPPISTGQSA